MTGLIMTLMAFGVIGTLMIVGIRMKLPPPDPDWREHLPAPAPPRSRLWWGVWFGRYPVLLAGVLAAGFRANHLALALMVVFFVITYAAVAERVVVGFRLRKAQRPAK